MIFLTKAIKLEKMLKQSNKASAKRTGVGEVGAGAGGKRQAPRPAPLHFLLILSCVQLVH